MTVHEELAVIKRYLVDLGINGDRAMFLFVNRMFKKYPELWNV